MSGAKAQLNVAFDGFQKRSGLVVPFSWQKIELAIDRAVDEIARKHHIAKNEGLASKVTDQVLKQLNNPLSEFYVHPDENRKRIPKIEDVQDLVEIVLAEQGETLVVAAYKRYRKQREIARRNIRVRGIDTKGQVDVSDAGLLVVESSSSNVNLPWDRKRIVKQILDKTDLSIEVAINVAKSVENRIIASDLAVVNTTLIRELVNNELMERGYSQQLRDLSLYRVSKDYIEQLMFTKSTGSTVNENNNADAVNHHIAEQVLKQWALDTVFSPEVKRAHDTGALHLHDLGSPTRVYSSSHSIEYIKKYGLTGLINLTTISGPARSASVLTSQLSTFLSTMQSNYTGALDFPYVNILYAPFLSGMADAALYQAAQELVFNVSQNVLERNGQRLCVTLNLHAGVPAYLKSVPAVGPGGRYQLRLKDGAVVGLQEELRKETDAHGYRLMDLYYDDPALGRRLVLRELADDKAGAVYDPDVQAILEENGEAIVTYGDYAREAQEFCRALLYVFGEGDAQGHVFEYPKCHFHLSEDTFEEPIQFSVFQEACELVSRNGSTYFVLDRNESMRSACDQLRSPAGGSRMFRHPESMRYCGFQNVAINIPQASYRAARTGGDIMKNFIMELDRILDLAVDAHLQKKAKVAELLSSPGRPLWQIGKEASDGKPYVDLDNCTYLLSLIGVNDAVHFLIGQELHESKQAQRLGLRIVAHMYAKAKKLAAKHSLHFILEDSPAESAARRLAKSDMVYFPEESKDIVKGPADAEFYTNSTHLAGDAEISLPERIVEQSKYHTMVESGTIIHCLNSKDRPEADSAAHLLTDVFYRSQTTMVCLSPAFTCCEECHHLAQGLLSTCPECGSAHVVDSTRNTVSCRKMETWSTSKRYKELQERHEGKSTEETERNVITKKGT